ncbi:MAG: hypothetical protein KDG50_13085 [Chromatiales bacterium]|nr:hypothetical protein [Chromatiales bacterium]
MKYAPAMVGLILLTGCASVRHQPISSDAIGALGSASTTTSAYDKPDFMAFTAGKAYFGVLGVLVAVSEGNKIIEENNVPDPAVRIGNSIAEYISLRRGVTILPNATVANSDSLDSLSDLYQHARFIIDIKTLNWSFVYFSSDWNNYHVHYAARMRLIDTQSKEIVAEDTCQFKPEYSNTDSAPTYDALVSTGAAGLKSELFKAEEFCTDFFEKGALLL